MLIQEPLGAGISNKSKVHQVKRGTSVEDGMGMRNRLYLYCSKVVGCMVDEVAFSRHESMVQKEPKCPSLLPTPLEAMHLPVLNQNVVRQNQSNNFAGAGEKASTLSIEDNS